MNRRLRELCGLEGVSGREKAVREYILEELTHSPAEMDVETDALGNVIARITGRQRAARTLLFAAHMDEVGFMITGATEEGFLRFVPVGGLHSSVVYGRRVRVNGHTGVIGGKAKHLCKPEEQKTAPALDKLLIDVGVDTREEALEIARPGDTAVFDSRWTALGDGLIQARALDDRAGCALLLELASAIPAYDVTLAFTVQEEVGLRGAKTAAFAVNPDVAVVVEATTAADIAGVAEDKQVCRLGDGPAISFMDGRTLYDKELYDNIFQTAERIGVPVQAKTMASGGNDAGAIHLARGGVRVAAVSLPCRYIHSPCCVLFQRDMEGAAVLLRTLAEEWAAPEESL